MFGYATNETTELMPMPIVLAHRLTKRLAEVRKKKILKWVRPDGKSQVSVEYVNGKPKRLDAVVVSTQHSDKISTEALRAEVRKHIIEDTLLKRLGDPEDIARAESIAAGGR